MSSNAPAVPPQPKLEEFTTLPLSEALQRFAKGVENFDRTVIALKDTQLDTAFLPSAGAGRWPIRVLLGHLADAELAFVQRMRRVVAEERPVLSVWDENAFVDRGLYGSSDPATGPSKPIAPQSVGAFIATIYTLRKWHAEWLAALPQHDWQRTGLHPVRGEMSLRLILDYDTWHLEHHAWFLKRKMDKLRTGMML